MAKRVFDNTAKKYITALYREFMETGMEEENKSQNTDEGNEYKAQQGKPKGNGFLNAVLSTTIYLSRQAFALAKKKFDEAGGTEGIKKKAVEFGTEVKAGFVPDADKAGFKRHASRFSNLWKSGKAGKTTLIAAAIIVLLLVFGRGGREEAEPADSLTVASAEASTVASADDIAQYVDGLANQFDKEEEYLKQNAENGQVKDKQEGLIKLKKNRLAGDSSSRVKHVTLPLATPVYTPSATPSVPTPTSTPPATAQKPLDGISNNHSSTQNTSEPAPANRFSFAEILLTDNCTTVLNKMQKSGLLENLKDSGNRPFFEISEKRDFISRDDLETLELSSDLLKPLKIDTVSVQMDLISPLWYVRFCFLRKPNNLQQQLQRGEDEMREQMRLAGECGDLLGYSIKMDEDAMCKEADPINNNPFYQKIVAKYGKPSKKIIGKAVGSGLPMSPIAPAWSDRLKFDAKWSNANEKIHFLIYLDIGCTEYVIRFQNTTALSNLLERAKAERNSKNTEDKRKTERVLEKF